VPDRIVLLPGGRVYFVETKRPKDGELSALQIKWQEWLIELGFSCWTIWTEGDLAFFLLHTRIEGAEEKHHETD
jgi:hypothetical protein